MERAKTHGIIKAAYISWSVLYLIETLISFYSPNSKTQLADLSLLVPPQELDNLYKTISISNLIVAILTISLGWLIILMLPKDKNWVFSTLISSCILSMIISSYSLFFPDAQLSFIMARLLPIANLTTLYIMLHFAYRFRKELRS